MQQHEIADMLVQNWLADTSRNAGEAIQNIIVGSSTVAVYISHRN